jgi:dTDP-4-amino-4,6-dideoxygalactose transaminase
VRGSYLVFGSPPILETAIDGDLPNAEWTPDRTLSLPHSPKLGEQDDDVILAVRNTAKWFVR